MADRPHVRGNQGGSLVNQERSITVTLHLPPEAIGAINLAIRHLKIAKQYSPYARRNWKVKCQRHVEKAQKLIAKAARIIRDHGITL